MGNVESLSQLTDFYFRNSSDNSQSFLKVIAQNSLLDEQWKALEEICQFMAKLNKWSIQAQMQINKGGQPEFFASKNTYWSNSIILVNNLMEDLTQELLIHAPSKTINKIIADYYQEFVTIAPATLLATDSLGNILLQELHSEKLHRLDYTP